MDFLPTRELSGVQGRRVGVARVTHGRAECGAQSGQSDEGGGAGPGGNAQNLVGVAELLYRLATGPAASALPIGDQGCSRRATRLVPWPAAAPSTSEPSRPSAAPYTLVFGNWFGMGERRDDAQQPAGPRRRRGIFSKRS
jgi:hypothetical protein